ncbi:MAG: glutathione S-transferase family protein [Alphaproteobacteria bacterium]|nr:glutathione S-transferase family protein [Pseudomonadota bacterium]
MRTLYHLWLSPFCRKVRVVLREKGAEFEMSVEKVWERRTELLAMNPAGTVPILIEPDGEIIADSGPICEYLEDIYPEPALIGTAPLVRAEVRRLIAWFDQKFDHEVTENLLGEKFMKRFMGLGEPNSEAIRAGQTNFRYHLDYVGYLAERRKWLAGEEFSLADIAAAAHISSLDYIGVVPWENYPSAKDWYARVKSRPSFRGLLADRIPGATPPKHYADLDF